MSTKTTSGDATECFSADVVAPADDYMVDVEFLNTITLPNFPSHSLKLKKYMPLMLLRNLSPPDGLCNGTRLILLEVINGPLLKCEIATGKNSNNAKKPRQAFGPRGRWDKLSHIYNSRYKRHEDTNMRGSQP